MTLSKPPFSVPSGIKITGSKWEERAFPPGISDGLESRWPRTPDYRPSGSRGYQIKIAQDWAEREGVAEPDTMYFLPDMPEGYRCFEKDQPSGSQVYKRLFGHPSGRFYDSIVRFETHVWWLLDGKKGVCHCLLCGHFKSPLGPPRSRNKTDASNQPTPVSKPSIRSHGPRQVPELARQPAQRFEDDNSSRSDSVGALSAGRRRRPARGLGPTKLVDEEGTFNVWKDAVMKLYSFRDDKRAMDWDIRESDSTDWLSERDTIPQYFTQIEQQHSFIPRKGELVLWLPSFPEELFLQRDPASGQYRSYDANHRRFVDHFPQWRGGVVTSVPSRAAQNGAVDFTDILTLPEKKTALNTSGFRVETMPDPNNTDKSLSKQYRYVPLRNIRPLSHWQLLLNGIPQKDLHASVLYALTCMTSISLIDKWKVKGDWKDGRCFILAKGMYIGSELITIGDAVRLTPEPPGTFCTDIMIVENIRLYLEELEYEHIDPESTKLCSRSKVTLLGKSYTTQSDRAFAYSPESRQVNASTAVSTEDVKGIFRPVGTALYGSWYPLHDANHKCEVSYDQVLGRLYEAEALRLWSGQRQQMYTNSDSAVSKPDLGFDMSSIIAGRRYATKVDERIFGPPVSDPTEIRWIISDYRAQALDVASINGREVGPYFEARTPATLAAWRAHIKISNGEKVTAEELTSAIGPRKQKQRPVYFHGPLPEIDSTPRQVGGKKRGRPAGSKIIDGKMYRAEEIANMTNLPASSSPVRLTRQAEVIEIMSETDYSDEDEDDDERVEIGVTDKQTPQKHSSQMAGAALTTDSEEIEDDQTDEEDDSERKSQALFAAYGGEDGMSDLEVADTDLLNLENQDDEYLSAWKSTNKSEKNSATQQSSQPMSKSKIMQSVEQGHGSTVASIAQEHWHEEGDVTDEEIDLEDWKALRNARGGTEESSGGDYRPDEF